MEKDEYGYAVETYATKEYVADKLEYYGWYGVKIGSGIFLVGILALFIAKKLRG